MATLPAPLTEIDLKFGPHLSASTGMRLDTGVTPDKMVNTHCCFCGQQCGIRLLVKDEQVVGIEHYQWLCPPCRRAMVALAQGRLKTGGAPAPMPLPVPMPVYANPTLGQGPLSLEDQNNYYP